MHNYIHNFNLTLLLASMLALAESKAVTVSWLPSLAAMCKGVHCC